MPRQCWAEALGDCAGKISGEHVVSAALWTGPNITAVGGPWGEVPKDIGLQSLTVKNLCQRHNSRLSPFDRAGAAAFRLLTESITLVSRRKLIPPRRWFPVGFDIDGPSLERWFMKTAINVVSILKERPEWQFERAVGAPSLQLVRAIYGIDDVVRPMGLFVNGRLGDGLMSDESVRAELLYSEAMRISAVAFSFRGFKFLVNLTDEHIAGVRSANDDSTLSIDSESLHYHLNRINNDVNGYRSHYIDFHWPDSRFAHFSA